MMTVSLLYGVFLCLSVVYSVDSFAVAPGPSPFHQATSVVDTTRVCQSTVSLGQTIESQEPTELPCPSRRSLLLQVLPFLTSLAIFCPPAHAERSLGTVTESYRRYVPRMEAGFQFLANEMKDMIKNGKTDEVSAEISAEKGTKMSAMKGTMKIFATAFSDSVITSSTRELQLATLKTSDELDAIVTALKAGDLDKALESHRRAVFYAQIYAETANGLIPRSLDPIVGPTGVGKRLVDRDSSISGAF